jgi:hypothetical protein
LKETTSSLVVWVFKVSFLVTVPMLLPMVSYLSHYDLFAYSHSIQDIQCMSYDPRLKKVHPSSQRLSICTLFMKTHLIHMTTSEESLRVLFFTCSLTIDLLH